MMTEQTGGAGASLEDDTYEQYAPLEMGGSELPGETPVEQSSQEAQAEAPVEQPVTQAEQPPVQPVVAQQQAQEDAHRVPLRELLDERDKRQAQQREVEALRRQLQQFQSQQQQQNAPEFWEQPEGNIDYRVHQAVAPLVQELVMQREQTSRALASMQYGEDKVNEAFKDMEARINAGDPVARFDYQRVMAQPNQYAALVQLHQQRKALSEIGNDPAAYRDKVLQDALSNPEFLAKAADALQAKAKSSPSVITYAAPKTKGLPSISNIGAAGSVGGATPDLSDQELYDKYTPNGL